MTTSPDAGARPGGELRPVVLVGFMGAGKSTVGRLLAGRLGVPFADSDDVIEQRAGRPPSEIFATQGEAAFRALERDVVRELVAVGGPGVVALGGGAVEDPSTREVLRRARVVHLEVSFGRVRARVGRDPRRPVLSRPDLPEVFAARQAAYRAAADVTVATDALGPEEVAERVLAALAPRP